MKPFLGLSAVLAAGALAFGVAVSGAGDAKGPPCADFVTGEGSYSTSGDQRIVAFNVTTAKVSCESITYTLYVTDSAGNELDSVEYAGGTLTTFSLESTFGSSGPDEVCVYATSSTSRGRIIDTAPDAGCPSPAGALPLDASGGNEFN